MKKGARIATKVVGLVVTSMVVAVAAIMIFTIIEMRDSTNRLTKNYMVDVVSVLGSQLDATILSLGKEEALSASRLADAAGDVSIEGIESSYTYVVSRDSTMLYHPTADKIGSPVENDAVKQLIAELDAGNLPEPDVIEYTFKGVDKYAAYYIPKDAAFIVVVTADRKDVFAEIYQMVSYAVFGALIICIICAVITAIITSKIISPIKLLNNEIRKLSNLNFTRNPDLGRLAKAKDECGQISASVIALEDQLQEVTTRLKQLTEQLFLAAEAMEKNADNTVLAVGQVEKATEEIAQGASSQAEETQTATENVVIMGDMVEETAYQVNALRNNAEDMDRAGDEALAILDKLSATNDRTRKSVDMVYQQTNVTNESVGEIRAAITMISEIAEQTNLLSLNASIEAARAGEMGRGFAVVASEIQKLAEQSNVSAQQIEGVIAKITEESEKSVEVMNEIKEIIAQQDADVRATEESFRRVKAGIDSSIQSIEHISSRTSELDNSRVKVVDVVQNLTAIAEENAASAEETLASASEANGSMTAMGGDVQNLDSVAKELMNCIELFTV